MLKTTEIWIMLLFDDKEFIIESKFLIPLRIAGGKQENENTGLDFPISIENWFNLSTIEHVIHIIFAFWVCGCVLLFSFVVVVVCLFSFFQCSWFSVSSSVFLCSDASSSFFSFYTREFVIYILKPHFFVCAPIGLPAIRNGTYVMYGTYIVPTLLHFCLVACYCYLC